MVLPGTCCGVKGKRIYLYFIPGVLSVEFPDCLPYSSCNVEESKLFLLLFFFFHCVFCLYLGLPWLFVFITKIVKTTCEDTWMKEILNTKKTLQNLEYSACMYKTKPSNVNRLSSDHTINLLSDSDTIPYDSEMHTFSKSNSYGAGDSYFTVPLKPLRASTSCIICACSVITNLKFSNHISIRQFLSRTWRCTESSV